MQEEKQEALQRHLQLAGLPPQLLQVAGWMWQHPLHPLCRLSHALHPLCLLCPPHQPLHHHHHLQQPQWQLLLHHCPQQVA